MCLCFGRQGPWRDGKCVPEPLCTGFLMPRGELGFKQPETWLFRRNSYFRNHGAVDKIKCICGFDIPSGPLVSKSDPIYGVFWFSPVHSRHLSNSCPLSIVETLNFHGS